MDRKLMLRLFLLAALLLFALEADAKPGRGGGHATQSIASVTPSSCSFTSGTTSGTVCVLTVTMNPASPPFAGSLALCTGTNAPVTGCSGANSGAFQLSGATILQSAGGSGTAPGSYTDVTVYAAQTGMTTVFQSLSLTGTAPQTIASITPSSCGFTSGTTNGAVCTLAVTMSPSSPSFAGTLALCTGTNTPVTGCSGVNTGGFHLAGAVIEQSTGGSGTAAGSYTDVTAYAAQGSLTTIFQPLSLTGSTAVAANEEFVGPFASWNCAASSASGLCGVAGTGTGAVYCNADTTGTTDVSTVIQSCITNNLTATNPVLYFPCGIYKLATGLTETVSQASTGLIGQDNSTVGGRCTTTIKWAGANNGTMLSLTNVTYGKFNRLTFDGNCGSGCAAKFNIYSTAPNGDTGTYNETTDNVFSNAAIGYQCGDVGIGPCAELPLLRDQFINLTTAGVSVGDANALDIWCWYCYFSGNAYGITNNINSGSGDFSVYKSVFLGSTLADIAQGNTVGSFNYKWNYSSGSFSFISSGGINDISRVTVQGNTILNTTGSGGFDRGASIRQGDNGPLILIDNVICSRGGAATPVVLNGGGFADVFSMGNTFTTSPTIGSYNASGPNTKITSVNDVVTTCPSVTQPTLPGTPPNLSRTIFEATTGGSGTTCSIASPCSAQTAICKAHDGTSNCSGVANSNHSVAHLNPGSYSASLIVPANSDIQIIGDMEGPTTVHAPSTSPALTLTGPSKVTVRDIQFFGNANTADGIVITNADQVGARVFTEQIGIGHASVPTGSVTNLFADALNNTIIEQRDNFNGSAVDHTCGTSGGTTGMGVNVVGGGSPAGASVNIFGHLTSCSHTHFNLSGAARVLVEDSFVEVRPTDLILASVTGNGSFTVSGGYLGVSRNPAINVNNFAGVTALLNAWTQGSTYTLTGTGGGAKNLGLGLDGNFSATSYYIDSTSPADSSRFLNSYQYADTSCNVVGGSCPMTDVGTADAPFLTTALAQLRATQPVDPQALGAGITDVRLYRVQVQDGLHGLWVQH